MNLSKFAKVTRALRAVVAGTTIQNGSVFGYEEFARRVAEAQAQNARRAGIWATA